MPSVVSHPPSTTASRPTTAPTGGRIRKRDRRRAHSHATRAIQHPRPRQSHHQHQKARRKQHRPRSSTFPYYDRSQRASSLGDIISGIVQHRYQAYVQKRASGTRSTPPSRSATALQLSKLQPASCTLSPTGAESSRRGTVSSSASFSFGVYNQQARLSLASASSSIGRECVVTTPTAIVTSGISSPAERAQSGRLIRQKHASAETELVLEESARKRASSPHSPRPDEVIDQRDIVMPTPAAAASSTAAASAARVAFGLLDSGSRSSAVSRTYTHMADTTTPSAFLTGLSSQCIHTLYAGSFVVYATNLAADWLHTYYACKGWSVSFALKPWLTILMIGCCAAGGICNFLLLYLCVENALRRRWDGDPFQGGFRLIFQRLYHWLTDFDCFRISFLILILENAPMTFVNYWFISSCSIPRPGKTAWTFAFACGATTLSIVWRAVMTFLAYKNLRCLRRPHTSSGRSGSKPTASAAAYFQLQQQASGAGGAMTIGEIQHQKIEAKISGSSSASTLEELRSLASGDLTNHYDECWPVRMSCWIMYNQRDDVDTDSSGGGMANGDGSRSARTSGLGSNLPAVRPPENCIGYCCQASCCFCLCVLFYAGMLITGCAPCAYHYTCRRNSRLHRHKFSRTCSRIVSSIFNVFVVVVTTILVLSLLVTNLIWLSSVQVIGNNRTPPEISQICLLIQPELRSIHPTLMTSIIPQHKEPRRSSKSRIDCKPLFELNDQWGFWWQRSEPGPWLYQATFVEESRGDHGSLTDQLAVQTEADVGRQAQETTKIYVQFMHGVNDVCQYKVYSNWTIVAEPPLVPLPWPYWRACDKTYVVEERVGSCQTPF